MPKKKKAAKSSKLQTYLKQRDHFYQKHPRSRILIGILIVAISVFVGSQYRNLKAKEFVSQYLWEVEEIEPTLEHLSR